MNDADDKPPTSPKERRLLDLQPFGTIDEHEDALRGRMDEDVHVERRSVVDVSEWLDKEVDMCPSPEYSAREAAGKTQTTTGLNIPSPRVGGTYNRTNPMSFGDSKKIKYQGSNSNNDSSNDQNKVSRLPTPNKTKRNVEQRDEEPILSWASPGHVMEDQVHSLAILPLIDTSELPLTHTKVHPLVPIECVTLEDDACDPPLSSSILIDEFVPHSPNQINTSLSPTESTCIEATKDEVGESLPIKQMPAVDINVSKRKPDRAFNIILVGDSGVGKSSLLLTFVSGRFSSILASTIGVDIRSKSMDVTDADGIQRNVKMTLRDTGMLLTPYLTHSIMTRC
jgi:hypothetical protein